MPPSELSARRLLFSALEEVFDVRFVARDVVDGSGCDAYVVVGRALSADEQHGRRIRALSFAPDESRHDRVVGEVAFHDSARLDGRLRRRRLTEREAWRGHLDVDDGLVLASDGTSRPLWVKKLTDLSQVDVVAVALPHLRAGEALRDHLVPGRFISLLPLVHFLREVSSERCYGTWEPAPLRATFIIDDPNLHWRSYGTLDYRTIAAHAEEIGYHIGMATIPLDAWFVYPPAARLFREEAKYLSLAIHGNDHAKRELGSFRTEADAVAKLAQALRRVEGLEARSGVRISRVMVPPHEACSEQTLRLLMLMGYDAVSITRPHPWISTDDQASPYATSRDDLASGWFPAEIRDDGFPILLRRSFSQVEEIPLRAYLDQPLIFYGHISDLSHGLRLLERVASEINSFPGVRWCSLGEIAASNFETRRPCEKLLCVRPFARRVRIDDLDGVDEIAIAWERPNGAVVRVECVGRDGAKTPDYVEAPTQHLRLAPEMSEVDVTLIPNESLDPVSVPSPRRHLRTVARRILTETRDRARPYVPWLSW